MPATPTKNKNTYTGYKSYSEYGRSRTYSNSNSNSSTAYDIPPLYPEVQRKKKPNTAPKKAEQVHRKKAIKVNKKQLFKVAVSGFVIFALCFTVLYRYGMILRGNQEIKNLESELNGILSANQAIKTKIDKQMELSEIEKYAKNELGMMKPQPYQVFYIDMNMQDKSSEGAVSENSGSVTGIPGTLMNAFKVLN